MDIVHPNFSTGKPCRCPWGAQRIHRDPERFGKTASKIDWLKGRPDYENDPKVRAAVNILQHNYPENADAMFPWLIRELKKGRLALDPDQEHLVNHLIESINQGEGKVAPENTQNAREVGLPAVIRQHTGGMRFYVPGAIHPNDEHNGNPVPLDPQHVGEWASMLEHMGKRRKGLDLMQHTFPELAQKMDEYQPEWEESQRQHLGDVMHRFDDGWSVRRLKNGEETHREGKEMGSCVGGYQPDHIYSLRDKGNRPHATVEIHPKRYDDQGNGLPHGGSVYQVQGKGNGTPNPEHMDRLGEWINSFKPEDKPTADTAKTEVPIPHAPDEFLSYMEPEQDYDNVMYRLSEEQAYDMNLGDGNEDEYVYQGDPHWEDIAEHTFRRGYNSAGPLHDQRTIERMVDGAHEMGIEQPMKEAFAAHQPAIEKEFWDERYDPNHWQTPEAQFGDWWKGNYLNYALDGNTLSRDEEGNPIGTPAPPQIHPDQQQLFHPTDTQTPWSDYPLPTIHSDPAPFWNMPNNVMSKIAATDHPLYYRWVFSPSSGEVDLANNNEPEVRYHGEMARDRNEPDLAHGYAYRIGGGYRLTDWEHKPVEDPYVVAQVMRKLRGEQGPANQSDWDSSGDDWDRMHAGMPGEL